MQYIYQGEPLVIADAHTHIYPEKIAVKATASVGEFYGRPMPLVGYPDTLLKSGEEIGVAKYLVCSVATKPEQSRSINAFLAEECRRHPQFLGFAALHPLQTDWETEIDFFTAQGLRGVKFHPDFQKFEIDAPYMLPLYEQLRALNLPILFHMGDDRYDYSAPRRLANILHQLPGLTVIAAHFGGYRKWKEAAELDLRFETLWMDTSSSLWTLDPVQACRLIEHYGAERLLFGTDFPMWRHREELDRFLALDLSKQTNDLILYQNFKRLFNLTFG